MKRSAHASRNKNFEACETPEGRIRLRSERIVRSLLADILESDGARAVRAWRGASGKGYAVRVELKRSAIRYVRTTYLSAREFGYLKSLPPLGGLLTLAKKAGTSRKSTDEGVAP